MLKKLAMLVVLTVVAVGFLSSQEMPRNAPEQRVGKPGSSQNGSSKTDPSGDNQAAANVPLTAPQPATPTCDEACQQGRENLAIQRKLEWFTGVLAIVGVLQVATMVWQGIFLRRTWVAIHSQANTMEIQAKEAKESAAAATAIAKEAADAALLNAKALMNVERPWLLENIVRDGDNDQEWIVSMRNAGNTPAEVIDGYCSISHLSGDFKLPADYRRSPFILQNTVIVKTDSFEVDRIDMRRWHEHAIGGFRDPNGGGEFKFLYLHGEVKYWDTFTDRSSPIAKPHVTQWCYVYNPQAREFSRAPGTNHDHS
jgi:hypothetical protein